MLIPSKAPSPEPYKNASLLDFPELTSFRRFLFECLCINTSDQLAGYQLRKMKYTAPTMHSVAHR